MASPHVSSPHGRLRLDPRPMPPVRAPTAAPSLAPATPLTPTQPPMSPPASLFSRSPRTPSQSPPSSGFGRTLNSIADRAAAVMEGTQRIAELEALVLRLGEENRRLKHEAVQAKAAAAAAIKERNQAQLQLQKLQRSSLADEIDGERFNDFASRLMFPSPTDVVPPGTSEWDAEVGGRGQGETARLLNPRELPEARLRASASRATSRAAAGESLVPPTPSPRGGAGQGQWDDVPPPPPPKRAPASSQVKRFGTLLSLFETISDELDLRKCVQGICREAAGLVQGKGVVGYVGQTGRSLNIRDAALIPGVAEDVEAGATRSGTTTLLCAPIADRAGSVFAVIQVTNKKLGARFTREDEIAQAGPCVLCVPPTPTRTRRPQVLLGVLLSQAAVALRNAQADTARVGHVAQLRALAQLRGALLKESTPTGMIRAFHERAAPALAAERVVLFLLEGRGSHELESEEFWSLAADARVGISGGSTLVKSAFEGDEVMNIADATTDSRFSSEIDRRFHTHTKTALVAPVRRTGPGSGLPLAVVLATNRKEQPFGPHDEEIIAWLAADLSVRLSSIITFQSPLSDKDKERVMATFVTS
eukprot:tig00000404_g387.t1